MSEPLYISLHITTKNQSLIEIDSKISSWLKKSGNSEFFIDRCFLPIELKSDPEFPKCKLLNSLIGIYWYSKDYNTEYCRIIILQNVRMQDGISLFVGDIIGQTKEDYDIAMKFEIDCVCIP